jgi:antitoxin component YwqK of YwqJK toxin-antitoxin module
MKTFLLFFSLYISGTITAQQKQQYYTWDWKQCELPEARFISKIKKTDSGYARIDYFLGNGKAQMYGSYADAATTIKNGFFRFYYSNGTPSAEGVYEQNKKQGPWLSYYRDGLLKDSTNYKEGIALGTSYAWHQNGYMADSTVNLPGGGSLMVSWYDNGLPSAAGHTLNDKLQGPWQYFHINGKIAAKETYDSGRLVSRAYYNERGIIEPDTSSKDRSPDFDGGDKAWRKFVDKTLYFPKRVEIGNTDKIVIVISAVIDEEGNVTNPVVEIPFEETFDAIALALFKKSPKWLPAIRHNRTVKEKVTLPVSFGNGENHYFFY